MEKSVANGIYEQTGIDPGFYILEFLNEEDANAFYSREVRQDCLQFHFCVKGSGFFQFNNNTYTFPASEGKAILLYNPKKELPINLTLNANSWLLSIIVPISKLHSFFSNEANYITFLSEENSKQKYYQETLITPSMAVALNQLLQFNLHPSVKPLYFKAKAYELLSLYFNKPEELDIAQCPFLASEANVNKIKQAKEIIIKRMAEPPSLQELADEVQMPINRLKEGFKQIYGDSVFSFLLEYKMEVARQLLASGTLNVNEVGLKLGYSTASHFIAAFKKRYGTTPKKFTMGQTV
ncbi:AraC family transcriptional regulator [Gilvibacter sp. SZ-19]|uniref:helix-turn-helix domain-containing protein n=1 Tax=unclassified Gilvibacter TaxID=2625242 RepID=UPI000B3CE472|nr:AraC family transcriptional regulator [Gilvibacter sp. SZ-19]ARV11776.1 AraC family transcriptional regulator [Gilvibacter sp. SZ-19]